MKFYPLSFFLAALLFFSCTHKEVEIKSDPVKIDSVLTVASPANDSLLKKDTVLPVPPQVVFVPPDPGPEPYPDPRPEPIYVPDPPDRYLPLDTTGPPPVDPIFTSVDHPAEFPGGEAAMREFINKNIRYPQMAVEAGIEGKVVVSFVVETNGALSNFEVVRAVNPMLDKEAFQVVKMMPDWVPASHNGKPVRMRFNLPVNFSLD